MKTTSTFNLALFLLVILSTFACKGHKSGEDNQTTDTVMVAKDYTQFILKHLDVDKKKVMPYVTCSGKLSTRCWQLLTQRTAKPATIVWKSWA